MANNFKVSIASRKAELDALRVLLDGGFLDILDGSQPATPDTAITSQVRGARLTLGNPAFAAASNVGDVARIVANAITSDSDADATITATWFRAYKTDGTTAVCDGTVGTASADAIINSVAIQQHARVDCSSLVISL
jgi:hypothetical protein